MPSFISNSSSTSERVGTRDILLLLATCLMFCVVLELGTTSYFSRVSQMESRRQAEYQNAVRIRSLKDQAEASVLVVGNSLLLEGINFPQLQQDAGSQIELRRMVVENTFYLDWYYGLRRMFRLGASPDIVAIVLNPIQLTSSSFNGDYSAHLLVDHRDLLSFAKDVAADHNATSSLALANLSSFYGSRTEIRTWILGKILPELPRLFHSRPATPKLDALSDLTSQRLIQLRDLCTQHGAQLVVVLPPARLSSGVDMVLQAAASNGVQVLLPIAPGVLPSSDYSDNFHLNAQGAGKFTPALADGLKQVVNRISPHSITTASAPADHSGQVNQRR